jgi:hypothetical protein
MPLGPNVRFCCIYRLKLLIGLIGLDVKVPLLLQAVKDFISIEF